MTDRDRLIRFGSKRTPRLRLLHHIDVVTNTPVGTRDRAAALRLDMETAERIRFNLTARGYRVEVGDAA